jgi:predicted membrane-bound dolichyl-phosphate-mannose-protein mannosyltransferase
MKRTKIIGIVFLIGLTLFIIGYLLGGLNHMQYIFFMTTFK